MTAHLPRLILVLATLGATIAAHADRLDMLGMGILSGDRGSFAADINDLGAMAGYSSAYEFGSSHATVWSKTTGLKKLPQLFRDKNSEGKGINNIGTVVGNSDQTPFLWTQALGIKALALPQGSVQLDGTARIAAPNAFGGTLKIAGVQSQTAGIHLTATGSILDGLASDAPKLAGSGWSASPKTMPSVRARSSAL